MNQNVSDPNIINNPRMIIPQQSEIVYEIYIEAKNSIAEDMLIWLDTVEIKEMLNFQGFKAAKLYTLINDDSQSKTKKNTYYSVQFLVESIDILNSYLANYGDKFRQDASAKYGKNFIEERRILSFQKFYTYDTTFNPNTNVISNVVGNVNTILNREPVLIPPQQQPNITQKKSFMTNIKDFFGFTSRRELNLLVDNSNVSNLAPNPILAKNVYNPILEQNTNQINIENRDQNLFFNSKKNKDLIYPSSADYNNQNINQKIINEDVNPNLERDPYSGKLENNFVYDVNNQNKNINRQEIIDLNQQNLAFSKKEPIVDQEILREREKSRITDQNIVGVQNYSEKINEYKYSSNIPNPEGNLGSYNSEYTNRDANLISDQDRKKNIRENLYEKEFVEDKGKEEIFNKDFNHDYIKDIKLSKDYMGNLGTEKLKEYEYDKDKGIEKIIVEKTTEVKDLKNNQKFLKKDIYMENIEKDKLNYENKKKTDLFESPSNIDYSEAYDYEDKENDINIQNRYLDKDKYVVSGKDDILEKEFHYIKEKQIQGKSENISKNVK